MIRRLLAVILLAASLLALLLFAGVASAQRADSVNLPFIEKNGALYIEATVNGARVLALLDSGSNRTLIDESVIPHGKCRKVALLTAAGDTQVCEMEAVVTLQGLTLPSAVLVYRLPAGLKALIPLRDLAPDGSVTLDFKNHRLIVKRVVEFEQ